MKVFHYEDFSIIIEEPRKFKDVLRPPNIPRETQPDESFAIVNVSTIEVTADLIEMYNPQNWSRLILFSNDEYHWDLDYDILDDNQKRSIEEFVRSCRKNN